MPSLYQDFANLLPDLHNPEDSGTLRAIAIVTAASARYSPEGCLDWGYH